MRGGEVVHYPRCTLVHHPDRLGFIFNPTQKTYKIWTGSRVPTSSAAPSVQYMTQQALLHPLCSICHNKLCCTFCAVYGKTSSAAPSVRYMEHQALLHHLCGIWNNKLCCTICAVYETTSSAASSMWYMEQLAMLHPLCDIWNNKL